MLFALWQPEKSTCVRRFELPTPWSVAKCSIQLSYTHILFILNEQVILYNSFWRMSTVFLIFLNFFYCWFISNYIDISTRNSSYFPTMKWGLQGSNLWPSACKADALPAELRSQEKNKEVEKASLICFRPPLYKLYIILIATRMGFEPTTSAVTGRRSNQLSHRAKY